MEAKKLHLMLGKMQSSEGYPSTAAGETNRIGKIFV